DYVQSDKINDLSLAILIKYAGVEILLGGDGTRSHWLFHRQLRKFRDNAINATVVTVPHHGSRYDFNEVIRDYIFANTGERYAIFSANGKTHPDEEVVDMMTEKGIDPYCTNLMARCGDRLRDLVTDPETDPELVKLLNQHNVN